MSNRYERELDAKFEKWIREREIERELAEIEKKTWEDLGLADDPEVSIAEYLEQMPEATVHDFRAVRGVEDEVWKIQRRKSK